MRVGTRVAPAWVVWQVLHGRGEWGNFGSRLCGCTEASPEKKNTDLFELRWKIGRKGGKGGVLRDGVPPLPPLPPLPPFPTFLGQFLKNVVIFWWLQIFSNEVIKKLKSTSDWCFFVLVDAFKNSHFPVIFDWFAKSRTTLLKAKTWMHD
jgi:hypothetical protein